MAATLQFGALTTTAATADQVVLTFTPTNVTSWKCAVVSGYLTTYSATASNMGVMKCKQATVDKAEFRIQNTANDTVAGVIVIPYGNGITFNGADVLAWTVTPAATTSMRWTASMFGDG